MLRKFRKRLATALLGSDAIVLKAALERCRQRIPQVGTLIDVGASNGSWSLLARQFFPEMACFMIEAQVEHAPVLEKLKSASTGFDFVLAAAGDKDGSVFFQEGDLFGGVAAHKPTGAGFRQVPMIAIDTLVKERRLKPPFLLKLDTHGFEVPILDGARETLSRSALLVIETYNFQLTPDSLRFHEICSYLEARGFRCVDLSNPVFRRDGVLWQMDLFFMPVDCAEFKKNSYA